MLLGSKVAETRLPSYRIRVLSGDQRDQQSVVSYLDTEVERLDAQGRGWTGEWIYDVSSATTGLLSVVLLSIVQNGYEQSQTRGRMGYRLVESERPGFYVYQIQSFDDYDYPRSFP